MPSETSNDASQIDIGSKVKVRRDTLSGAIFLPFIVETLNDSETITGRQVVRFPGLYSGPGDGDLADEAESIPRSCIVKVGDWGSPSKLLWAKLEKSEIMGPCTGASNGG